MDQANHPDVPNVVYHGTNKDISGGFHAPAFFAANPQHADYYANWRGEEGARVYPTKLSMKNPLDARSKEGTMKFIDVARRAGAKIDVKHFPDGSWDFDTDEISKHSPYDGTNLNDLMYSPRVRHQMHKEGYDGLMAHDQLANEEIPIFVPLHSHQIKHAIGKEGGGPVDQQGITAYHGSPHDFEQFDTSKIGTGEGAQAYGHGLYFAEAEPVAKGYQEALSANQPIPIEVDGKKHHPYSPMQRMVAEHRGDVDAVLAKMTPKWNKIAEKHKNLHAEPDDLERMLVEDEHHEAQKQRAEVESMRGKTVRYGQRGHMYEVHINAHPHHFLDWDRPLSEQSEHVQKVIKDWELNYVPSHLIGGRLVEEMQKGFGEKGASEALSKAGIKGIRYLDAGSRGTDKKTTHNYVVFDHNDVHIKRKYEQGGRVGFDVGGAVPETPTLAGVQSFFDQANLVNQQRDAAQSQAAYQQAIAAQQQKEAADAAAKAAAAKPKVGFGSAVEAGGGGGEGGGGGGFGSGIGGPAGEAIGGRDSNNADATGETGGNYWHGGRVAYADGGAGETPYEQAIKKAKQEFSYVGLRTVEKPMKGKIKNSSVWVEGSPTSKKLNGISATNVDHPKARIMHKLSEHDQSWGTGVYYGDHTYVVGSHEADQGEDPGELVMKNPEIIFGGNRNSILGKKENQGGRVGFADGGDIWDDSRIRRSGEGGTETPLDFLQNAPLYKQRMGVQPQVQPQPQPEQTTEAKPMPVTVAPPPAIVQPVQQKQEAPQPQGQIGLYAVGTNDPNPNMTVQSAQRIIDASRAMGIDPVFLLPNQAGGTQYAKNSRALQEYLDNMGIRYQIPQYGDKDPLHMTTDWASGAAKSYAAPFLAGDSNSVRMGIVGYGVRGDGKTLVHPDSGAVLGRVGATSKAVADELEKHMRWYQQNRPQRNTGGPVNVSKAEDTAGNFKKEHEKIHGIPVAIEVKKGHDRVKYKPGGKIKFKAKQYADYGAILGTKDADGMNTDVMVGPHKDSEKAYIIDQRKHDSGKFDEHKVMLGFKKRKKAIKAYTKSYADRHGKERVEDVVKTDIKGLKKWLKHGNLNKPASKDALIKSALSVVSKKT